MNLDGCPASAVQSSWVQCLLIPRMRTTDRHQLCCVARSVIARYRPRCDGWLFIAREAVILQRSSILVARQRRKTAPYRTTHPPCSPSLWPFSIVIFREMRTYSAALFIAWARSFVQFATLRNIRQRPIAQPYTTSICSPYRIYFRNGSFSCVP